MEIGCDLDGVLCNLHEEIYKRASVDFDDITHFSEWQSYPFHASGEVPEGWVRDLFPDPSFWLAAAPFEWASDWLEKQKYAGNRVHVITARGNLDNAYSITREWLRINDLDPHSLHIVNDRFNKIETLLDLKCDMMIEDDPMAANQIARYVPCYVLAHPYNDDTDIGQAIRINDIYEI